MAQPAKTLQLSLWIYALTLSKTRWLCVSLQISSLLETCRQPAHESREERAGRQKRRRRKDFFYLQTAGPCNRVIISLMETDWGDQTQTKSIETLMYRKRSRIAANSVAACFSHCCFPDQLLYLLSVSIGPLRLRLQVLQTEASGTEPILPHHTATGSNGLSELDRWSI